MTRNVYNKNIRRTIFGSLGRYIAIMAIIALGVGFFAGVKNTKGSMMETLDKYVQDQNMYDYRLISTYGFTEDDEKALQKVDAVAEAEGSVTADFFSQDRDGNSIILKAHSMTADINLPKLEKKYSCKYTYQYHKTPGSLRHMPKTTRSFSCKIVAAKGVALYSL